MNKTIRQNIPEVHYRPGHELDAGFELLELNSVYDRSKTMSHNLFAPHRVDFHHLIYICEGDGAHYIDFNRHPYRNGSFIFVNKHQAHAFDDSDRPVGYVVLFTQEFMDSIQVNIRIPTFATGFYASSESPLLTLEDPLKQSCENLLTQIKNIAGDQRYDSTIMRLLFMALLLKLHQEKPNTFPVHLSALHRQQLLEFFSLLHENFATKKSAAAYAEMMGITYKTLNQLCAHAAGKTPKQLIDQHTVLEAKRRLAIEQKQISQLAYEIGFEDLGNFVKYFKKHTLMTPSQFLESLSG